MIGVFAVVAALVSPAPATIGETFALDSAILHERRTINVYLPPGYAAGKERYPVLYMADGGLAEDFPHVAGNVDVSIRNEVMRPFIVVGVENIERRRDLLSASPDATDQKIAPHAGGADRFRRFLKEELKPAVAARYRVTGESGLIGESFAGLFVLETWLVAPQLFDHYIALAPSLWWAHGALVTVAREKLRHWSGPAKSVFVATASDERDDGAAQLDALARALKPPQLSWHYHAFPDERHATIFPVAELFAYRTLFPPLH